VKVNQLVESELHKVTYEANGRGGNRKRHVHEKEYDIYLLQ
jgi:hypothetical protein